MPSPPDDALLLKLRAYEVSAERPEYEFLRARPQWPPIWPITTRLFWRTPADTFAESNCVAKYHTVCSERSLVVLALPALSSSLAELRLDLTDRPAFLLLHSLAVCDSQGEILWRVDAGACSEELAAHGMRSLAAADGEGLLISGTSDDVSLLLPLEAAALDRLAGGGAITVEVSALDPWSYAARFADAARRRQKDDAARLRLTATALAHAQLLAGERDAHLTKHAAGLAEAQRLVAERDAQLQQYAGALAEAQRLVAERDAQLHQYAGALAAAERLLAERDARIRDLTAAFDHAQSLALQRHQELVGYDRALGEAQALATARASDLAAAREQIATRDAEFLHLRSEIDRAHHALARRDRSLSDLSQRLQIIENSLTWRLVRPLTGIRPQRP